MSEHLPKKLCMGLLLLFAFAGALHGTPTFAHKIHIFAEVDRSTIDGEVYFQGKVPAKNVQVTVLDPAGEVLEQLKTDENGKFSFQARFRCNHRLLVEAAPGHIAEFIIEAAQLPDDLPSRKPKAPKRPEELFKELDTNGDGKLTVDEFKGISKGPEVPQEFTLYTIGRVKKDSQRTMIVLDEIYQPGLLGLDGFSHVYVFYWFDRNDTPEKRSILQIEPHPPGNVEHPPLLGVFANRFPCRPNLIAMSLCKIVSVRDNVVEVEGIDALSETPVVDMKPHMPGFDVAPNPRVPDWMPDCVKKCGPK